MSEPILSICIPTYDRLDILRKTLNSIYEGVNEDLLNEFEVIISDNSKNHSCQILKNEFVKYTNFFYKISECEGFLNSYYALSYGKGTYLKLHNNYTMLRKGSLNYIINLLKNNIKNKPLIFFSDGYKLKGNNQFYYSFDNFIRSVSYFSSWSSGFGIWKEDFNKFKEIKINKFYPQTSLLLTQTYKKEFLLNDVNLFLNQSIPNKGGYNIFRVFSVDYLDLIKETEMKGLISSQCYKFIKKSLLYKFLSVRYFKTVIAKMDNFQHSRIKESILVNYSPYYYYTFIIASFWGPFRFFIREFYRAHYTRLK